MRMWGWFSSIFTILGIIVLIVRQLPLPFFDYNGTTIMFRNERAQISTAKALGAVIGKPDAELNTKEVLRILFREGTSLDVLVHPPAFNPLYEIVALKSVVLPFWSRKSADGEAEKMAKIFRQDGFRTQIIVQPDFAFPPRNVVLLLSDALCHDDDLRFGSAIVIRNHALRIGGQLPRLIFGR